MKNQQLKGSLSIGRPSGNGPERITIQLEDDLSGIRFVDIEIDPADFARALTGLHGPNCQFQLRGLDRVGMQREHKEEIVTVQGNRHGPDFDERVRAVVAVFEVDGWQGRDSDANNSHRITYGDDSYRARVVFERWVEAKPDGD